MTNLESLQEEDLFEIGIEDAPLEPRFRKSGYRSRGRPIYECKEAEDISTSMGQRSHSHPEIHELASIELQSSELSKEPTPLLRSSRLYGASLSLHRYNAPKHKLSESLHYRPQRIHHTRVLRRDPWPKEEKMKSLQSLLTNIYHEDSASSSAKDLTDSWTESFQSDVSVSSPKRYTIDSLQKLDVPRLRGEVEDMTIKIEQANCRLMRMVRQRAFYKAKQNTKCAVLSAILMAISPKTSDDSKLKFSLEPQTYESGVEEWKQAMRAMARLPGGIPNAFRSKLWSTLGELHILSTGQDWEQICHSAFSEQVQPDDIEIHSQIIKDLHRTGWSEFDDEKRLKQVLFAYARYNKEVGYCQGFNIIAALILQVVDYRADTALKIMIFLIEHVLPRGYFDQSLRALSIDMTVMKDLLMQRVPVTFEHLEKLKNSSGNEYEPPLANIFSMHWFLTLFATCLPRECVLRLWDALMLHGSEVLLRTAVALWSKMSRMILRTTTADEFYSLMGKLCKELIDMNAEEQDHLITVVYTMAEFPYPGLEELREKYTWNIHPLSTTFNLFRRSVTSVLHDETPECEPSCSPCLCRRRNNSITGYNLRELEEQYYLTKERQKQAAVIMKNPNSPKPKRSRNLAVAAEEPVFNHLLMGPMLAKIDCTTDPPTSFSGGAFKLTATVVQPASHTMSRLREMVEMVQESSVDDESKGSYSSSISSVTGHYHRSIHLSLSSEETDPKRSTMDTLSFELPMKVWYINYSHNSTIEKAEWDNILGPPPKILSNEEPKGCSGSFLSLGAAFNFTLELLSFTGAESQDSPSDHRSNLRRSKKILKKAAAAPAFKPTLRIGHKN